VNFDKDMRNYMTILSRCTFRNQLISISWKNKIRGRRNRRTVGSSINCAKIEVWGAETAPYNVKKYIHCTYCVAYLNKVEQSVQSQLHICVE
jgi:hypothetical protein